MKPIRWDGATAQRGVIDALEWLNPVVGSPTASFETLAYLDSFVTSLMPRTSILQGAIAGLNLITARAIARGVDGATVALLPPAASLPVKLGVRAVTAGVGKAASQITEAPDESMWRSGLRSGGSLLTTAAISGAVWDVGSSLRSRYPNQRIATPLLVTGLTLGGAIYWASRRLAKRKAEIVRWPIPQTNTIPGTLVVGAVVSNVGRLVGYGFKSSRGALIKWAGPGLRKNVLARTANAGLWGLGAAALYNAGVGYIGRANEKIDPGYATPPESDLVSGSPSSIMPFSTLGQQGRRYVSDVVTPDLIEEILEEPAQHPIRTYVGFNSEPIYISGRAELALDELDRTGAFDREYLLLISPTGTGWVDHTMIEAAEILTRGNIATCCIQYGRYPSFLSVQKVALGRRQFRLLLWGVKQRLRERAPEMRPKVLVFGESLGAWASSDVIMYQGIAGFDHYGIDRALWVGLPGLAKWSRNGMAQGSSDLVPEGTVRVFDHPDEIEALSEEELLRLRATILSHANDPIAALRPEMAFREPDWLKGAERGRGVPPSMEWIPVATLLQTMIDAANAMVTVPGKFGSFGHDYRADTARMVRAAFDLEPVTNEQMERIEMALRSLELDRSERIKAQTPDAAPPAPSQQVEIDAIAGVPLRRRTSGASWKDSALFSGLRRRDGNIQ